MSFTSKIAAGTDHQPRLPSQALIGASVTAFVCALLSAAAGSLLNDPDTLWHIRSGLDILKSGELPKVDPYSHTFAGAPWIAKEWLAQILLAAEFSIGGWPGVACLTIAAIALGCRATYGFLAVHLQPKTAALIVIGAIYLGAGGFLARPHILSLPLAVFFVGTIWRAGQSREAPQLYLLGVLSVWANMHGGFVVGLAAAGFAFAAYVHQTVLETASSRSYANIVLRLREDRAAVRWVIFLLACPIACCAHPYGIESLRSVFLVMNSEAAPYIIEWRAFSAQEDRAIGFVLIAAIALALATGFRTRPIPALFMCLLLYLFLTHIRFAYLLFFLAPMVLADDIARAYPQLRAKASRRSHGKHELHGLGSVAVSALPAMCLLGGFLAVRPTLAPPATSYPVSAIDAARRAGLTQTPVLNTYAFGGALIFKGVPTFVDGRAERLFNNGFMHAIDQSKTLSGEAVIKRQIEQYGIQWSILQPSDPRAQWMEQNPAWRELHRDEHAVVHQRRDASALLHGSKASPEFDKGDGFTRRPLLPHASGADPR